MSLPSEWFCALLESASDVYFRYALEPERRVSYVSPSIQALTGHAPAEFYARPELCLAVIASADRRFVRRILRARRGVVLALRLQRDGVIIPLEVRTVAVVRHRRVVAIEGVARLARGQAMALPGASLRNDDGEPVQQRLAALMFEVHDLLHRVLPMAAASSAAVESHVLHMGTIALDCNRLTVTDAGVPVALTTREVLLLRYLFERVGRIVTRGQLLSDVWGYSYTGDDRTVDVHVSRLRRKLPSLKHHLTAIRNVGYRVDDAVLPRVANC